MHCLLVARPPRWSYYCPQFTPTKLTEQAGQVLPVHTLAGPQLSPTAQSSPRGTLLRQVSLDAPFRERAVFIYMQTSPRSFPVRSPSVA